MEHGSQDIYVRYTAMSGMWTWQVTSLYPQVKPNDNCLLLLLPRVTTVCVCLQQQCVWSRKGRPLFGIPPPQIMSVVAK